VDEDNLFVTGGSAGGIMTCWVVGMTRRFRAAATLYPVVNWYTETLTSDIPFYAVKYEFTGFPWDHTEEYMKFSPISLVGDVTTPTIVICGEEDYRCPIEESEQYYLALKMRGIETVLVRYPGASHGIRNRPSMQLSKVLHIRSWFDTHRSE
jgi:acylaminoacyl-peptidase